MKAMQGFNTLQADGYVSYHFTNLGGTFNPSLSDEVNIGKTILVTNHERINLK